MTSIWMEERSQREVLWLPNIDRPAFYFVIFQAIIDRVAIKQRERGILFFSCYDPFIVELCILKMFDNFSRLRRKKTIALT